jgi:PIN domain nuclease of toxin-antitoxin system
MKLLLDTHTVIWYINGNTRMPQHIRQILDNKSNDVYVSVISLWEISIKSQKGKLVLHKSLEDIMRLLYSNGFQFLGINPVHVHCLDSLPLRHKDPFDRMLIAQSLEDDFVLVSCDEMFDRYDARRLW